MARTVERRSSRTVRRSTVEGADKIKANLSNIAEEVARVRDQAREEVNALEKIRSMLDAGYLTDLLRGIEELETRIESLEDHSLAAQSEVDRYKEDLEQEQERLAKLWDAYKSQEDELSRLKRDYPLMEEKLFERERTVDNLRREVDRLEPFARFKKDAERLEEENLRLRKDLENAERDIDEATARIEELDEERARLQESTKDARRVQELEQLLEDERERLAKLYKVYEDVEQEKDDLRALVDEWQQWYRRVAPAMESVGTAPGTAPRK